VLKCRLVENVEKQFVTGVQWKHVLAAKRSFAMYVYQVKMIFVHVSRIHIANLACRTLLYAQRRDATRYTVPTVSSAMILRER